MSKDLETLLIFSLPKELLRARQYFLVLAPPFMGQPQVNDWRKSPSRKVDADVVNIYLFTLLLGLLAGINCTPRQGKRTWLGEALVDPRGLKDPRKR